MMKRMAMKKMKIGLHKRKKDFKNRNLQSTNSENIKGIQRT